MKELGVIITLSFHIYCTPVIINMITRMEIASLGS